MPQPPKDTASWSGTLRGTATSRSETPPPRETDPAEQDGLVSRPSFAKPRHGAAGGRRSSSARAPGERTRTPQQQDLAATLPGRQTTGEGEEVDEQLDPELQAIQRYAEGLCRRGSITASSKTDKGDRRTQGNLDYYTAEALRARRNIRQSPAFTDVCDRLWDLIPKVPRGIDRGMYVTVFGALAADQSLLPGSPGEVAVCRMLEKEWQYDSQGISWLDRPAFADALFDLIDMWSDGLDESAYIVTCDNIVAIFEQSPLPPPCPGEWQWSHPKDAAHWRTCGAAMGNHLEVAFTRDRRDQVPLPGMHVDPIGSVVSNVTADFLRMKLLLQNSSGSGALTYNLRRNSRRPHYVRRGFPGWAERRRGSTAREGGATPTRERDGEHAALTGSRRVSLSAAHSAHAAEPPLGTARSNASGVSTGSRPEGLGTAPPPRARSPSGQQMDPPEAMTVRCGGREWRLDNSALRRLPDSVLAQLRAPGGRRGSAADRSRSNSPRRAEEAAQGRPSRADEAAGAPGAAPGSGHVSTPPSVMLRRDPALVAQVLDFLSQGTRPRAPMGQKEAAALVAEWEWWGLPLGDLVPEEARASRAPVRLQQSAASRPSARAAPRNLLFTAQAPELQPLCGIYVASATGAGRDSQPIWHNGDFRVFSAKGTWMVGNSEDMRGGSGMLSGQREHGGRHPDDRSLGQWRKCVAPGSWAEAADVALTAVEVPAELAVDCPAAQAAAAALGATHLSRATEATESTEGTDCGPAEAVCGRYRLLQRTSANGWPVWERQSVVGEPPAWLHGDADGRWRFAYRRPGAGAADLGIGRRGSLSMSCSRTAPPDQGGGMGQRRLSVSSITAPPPAPPGDPLVTKEKHNGTLPHAASFEWALCPEEAGEGAAGEVPGIVIRAIADKQKPGASPRPGPLGEAVLGDLLAHPETLVGRAALLSALTQAGDEPRDLEVALPPGGAESLPYALDFYRTGACSLPPMPTASLHSCLRTLRWHFGVPSGAVTAAAADASSLYGFGFGGCPANLRTSTRGQESGLPALGRGPEEAALEASAHRLRTDAPAAEIPLDASGLPLVTSQRKWFTPGPVRCSSWRRGPANQPTADQQQPAGAGQQDAPADGMLPGRRSSLRRPSPLAGAGEPAASSGLSSSVRRVSPPPESPTSRVTVSPGLKRRSSVVLLEGDHPAESRPAAPEPAPEPAPPTVPCTPQPALLNYSLGSYVPPPVLSPPSTVLSGREPTSPCTPLQQPRAEAAPNLGSPQSQPRVPPPPGAATQSPPASPASAPQPAGEAAEQPRAAAAEPPARRESVRGPQPSAADRRAEQERRLSAAAQIAVAGTAAGPPAGSQAPPAAAAAAPPQEGPPPAPAAPLSVAGYSAAPAPQQRRPSNPAAAPSETRPSTAGQELYRGSDAMLPALRGASPPEPAAPADLQCDGAGLGGRRRSLTPQPRGSVSADPAPEAAQEGAQSPPLLRSGLGQPPARPSGPVTSEYAALIGEPLRAPQRSGSSPPSSPTAGRRSSPRFSVGGVSRAMPPEPQPVPDPPASPLRSRGASLPTTLQPLPQRPSLGGATPGRQQLCPVVAAPSPFDATPPTAVSGLSPGNGAIPKLQPIGLPGRGAQTRSRSCADASPPRQGRRRLVPVPGRESASSPQLDRFIAHRQSSPAAVRQPQQQARTPPEPPPQQRTPPELPQQPLAGSPRRATVRTLSLQQTQDPAALARELVGLRQQLVGVVSGKGQQQAGVGADVLLRRINELERLLADGGRSVSAVQRVE
eukprot:TRINITY_DN8664_c0_g1_i2.p1 TRINITY_DN8664_c0_g1~~TRINITY_DN8664_c0_g1_i2.p1  ORF type:complete len:1761 (+),score=377.51 TRINITY_DN8664_c0_g1_i2:155-5437(+)